MASTSTQTKAKPASKTTSKAKAAGPAKGKAAAASRPKPRPVVLNGQPAKNRHFLLDKALLKQATAKCRKDGLVISDVLRHGLTVYSADAPPEGEVQSALDLLPEETMGDLKDVWLSGDSDKATHYVAALHRAGWPTRAIADSLVASGAVEKMSRQAVSLRVVKAPEELREDLPAVPDLGPRRAIVSARKGKKGEYKPAKKKARDKAHDVGFRVEDTVYADASRRAKAEGAMMSGVLDEVLYAYLDGAYDEDFAAAGSED